MRETAIETAITYGDSSCQHLYLSTATTTSPSSWTWTWTDWAPHAVSTAVGGVLLPCEAPWSPCDTEAARTASMMSSSSAGGTTSPRLFHCKNGRKKVWFKDCGRFANARLTGRVRLGRRPTRKAFVSLCISPAIITPSFSFWGRHSADPDRFWKT